VASWREHQVEVAEFFRGLGLEARTDERLQGARAWHDIDVVVRGQRVGLQRLWLVECKHWSHPVGKVHVAALAEIVRDVGADRGLLLSESGFRAGAIRLAERSQVTLTSLEELHERSTGELLLLTLARFRRRLTLLAARLAPLTHAGRHSAGSSGVRPRPGFDMDAVLRLHAALGTAENGLQQADANDWPALYGWDFGRDKLLVANDPQQLWAGLTTALDEAERLLLTQEHALAAAHDDGL
jgi:restriction system protein